MGNYCCAFRPGPKIQIESANETCSITVVVAAEGRVVQVEVPASQSSMNVGELLLEFPPAHFLARFHRSSFNQSAIPIVHERPSPLGADSDAMSGTSHVYVLFPMPCLHTRITPQERLTFARLLHNPSPLMINESKSRAPADLRRPRPSSAKRICRLMVCGAARVAPHVDAIDDEQHEGYAAFSSTSAATHQPPAIVNMKLGGAIDDNHDQDEENLQELTAPCDLPVMMKGKPWVPTLETINEGREG